MPKPKNATVYKMETNKKMGNDKIFRAATPSFQSWKRCFIAKQNSKCTDGKK
jgi:hypothetical protein